LNKIYKQKQEESSKHQGKEVQEKQEFENDDDFGIEGKYDLEIENIDSDEDILNKEPVVLDVKSISRRNQFK